MCTATSYNLSRIFGPCPYHINSGVIEFNNVQKYVYGNYKYMAHIIFTYNDDVCLYWIPNISSYYQQSWYYQYYIAASIVS